ncbi:MAG TPA: tetratricopeptide repeat protein [Oculatellaceae cyanobacterium]
MIKANQFKRSVSFSGKNANKALKLSLLITVTSLGFANGVLNEPAYASKKHKEKENKSAPREVTQEADALLGLEPSTLHLVNQGKWDEAASVLEGQVKGATVANKKTAWLAFAYLYLNNCAKLGVLNAACGAEPSAPTANNAAAGAGTANDGAAPNTVAAAAASTSSASAAAGSTSKDAATTATPSSSAASSPNSYAFVISAFNKICEGKKDDAAALLQKLPDEATADPICVFAQAAVASKRGSTEEAARICRRVVAISPNFAWGFRTLGFLEQYSLKHQPQAEFAYEQALVVEPGLDSVRKTLIDLKVSRNDFDDALDVARAAIALHPDDPSAHYNLADQIFIKQWRLREASAELDSAIKLDSKSAKYYRAQAAVKRLQGDLKGALTAQEMAVQLGSDKAFELVELANLQQQAGESNKAADTLKEAIKLEPGNTSAHEKLILILENEHRYDELVVEYSLLLKDKPKDAKLHLRLAKALASAGKVADAEKEFVEAANLDPTDPEPHRQMGALKIKLKEFGQAAKEYTRALNINPSSVPDLVSLGYCYSENDDYMQAEAAYVTALALQQLLVQNGDMTSERLDIMRALAALLLHETRYADACGQFEAILAMRKPGGDPTLDQFMLARARALRDLTPKSGDEAAKAFSNLDKTKQAEQSLWLADTFLRMRKAPLAKDLVEPHIKDEAKTDIDCSWLLIVGRYSLATGNSDQAKEALFKIIDSKTASPSLKSQALRVMAEGLEGAGNLAEAEKTIRGALDAYAKNFQAYEMAGQIAVKNKDSKLALDFAKKTLEQNPYDARAYIVTGDAQMQLGQIKDAVTSYRKATELYPAFVQGHKMLSAALSKSGSEAEAKKEAELAASLESQQR